MMIMLACGLQHPINNLYCGGKWARYRSVVCECFGNILEVFGLEFLIHWFNTQLSWSSYFTFDPSGPRRWHSPSPALCGWCFENLCCHLAYSWGFKNHSKQHVLGDGDTRNGGATTQVVWIKSILIDVTFMHLKISLPQVIPWSRFSHTLRELRLLLLSSRPRTLQALPSGARKRCTWMRWQLWIRNVLATKTGILQIISVLLGTCCKHQSPFSKGLGMTKEKTLGIAISVDTLLLAIWCFILSLYLQVVTPMYNVWNH